MRCLLAGHETMRRLLTAPTDIHDTDIGGYETASESVKSSPNSRPLPAATQRSRPNRHQVT